MHPDEALVQQIIQGNDDAYDGLVQKYQNRIYTIAYRYTGNHADACDLTQETFIKVYQALGSFRGESAFATWLYRIAANVCRDELRRKKRKKTFSLDEITEETGGNAALMDETMSPEDSVEKMELQQLVQQCINSLSDEHRLILIMREMQGLSYEEIAGALQCSLGTVKSRLSRSRQALKQQVLRHKELLSIINRQDR